MADARQDLLLDALEAISFTVPEVPGLAEHLRVPGLRGRIGPAPHPASSPVRPASAW